MDLEFDQDSTTFNKSCELVDTTIEEAANSKKSLDSTMVSVTSLMKQVEYSERAAAQAKEAAAMSGLHILAKVDELKKKQQLAKETNDKHAGEVTARKAVLATEVKELQSRVSGVLNEGFTALGVLNQMRRDLKKRLTSALEEKKVADKEKVEREILARETLAYEESQMEKLVKDSERLKQEEVNNSKLQQFLLDRGHAIDILDEDISRKCQDVSLLKESLNQAVLSSNQTSSMLVSSTSSLTNDMSNEPAKSHVGHIDLEKSLGFGLEDDHVQGTTKEPMRREERVTLKPPIFFIRRELSSKIPNIDLKKQKVNKNLAVGADLNSSPSVSDIFTQAGHAQSAEGSVAFGQTYDQECKTAKPNGGAVIILLISEHRKLA
ncbi:hypothetical protein CTI12_AA598130 [Artemisia annua]|uniref:Uncharacterized protein n=1 Tax=Artemisia annua TaxID=35608 RepID=A0A2U1KIL9_ARTAN|nr:hypothetical protein CTI12_AA598130 [Artemisia annua]